MQSSSFSFLNSLHLPPKSPNGITRAKQPRKKPWPKKKKKKKLCTMHRPRQAHPYPHRTPCPSHNELRPTNKSQPKGKQTKARKEKTPCQKKPNLKRARNKPQQNTKPAHARMNIVQHHHCHIPQGKKERLKNVCSSNSISNFFPAIALFFNPTERKQKRVMGDR
jgi:hypothetical protein